MFENITAAPADPILGLADLFRADDRPEKINLGIGVYKDETGKTPVLTSVKKAEQYLLENETTKNYLGIDGIPEFGRCTQELLFGKGNAIIADKRARTAQTPGGTGALRVAADFLAKNTDVKRVWVSNPSWPNHKSVFTSAGLEVREYAYYDAANHALDFDGLLASLNEAQAGDVVLFHGCCHNPTGVDLSRAQWDRVITLVVEKNLIPFMDIAYQGFGDGLEEDAYAIRAMVAAGVSFFVSNSFSKNLSFYGERCGGLSVICKDAEEASRVLGQMKATVRRNYSSPPTHGGQITAAVMSQPELHAMWVGEVTEMRTRIKAMRQKLFEVLSAKVPGRDFSYFINQRGMFSYTGFTPEQVDRLREEFAVYLVRSGRMCVAGLNSRNVDYVADAMAAVLKG